MEEKKYSGGFRGFMYCKDSKQFFIIIIIVRTRFVTNRNGVGLAHKNAQIISFVEHGFERLGLGHQAVGFSWCLYMVKFSSPLESFSQRWAGGSGFWPFFPASSLDYLLFLLYQPASTVLCPRVGLNFPKLILVPSVPTQSRWRWL